MNQAVPRGNGPICRAVPHRGTASPKFGEPHAGHANVAARGPPQQHVVLSDAAARNAGPRKGRRRAHQPRKDGAQGGHGHGRVEPTAPFGGK